MCASSMTHRSSHGVPFSEGRNSNACSRVVPQHPIAKQSRPNARVEKGRIVDEIIEALTVHTYIENESMHPEVRDLAPPDLEDDILESYEEHHVADVLVVELAAMEPEDERFDAKTTVLIESVEHHIEEEEQEWYPKVREELGRKQLQEMSARMLELRDKAPRLRSPSPTRRPHAPPHPLWAAPPAMGITGEPGRRRVRTRRGREYRSTLPRARVIPCPCNCFHPVGTGRQIDEFLRQPSEFDVSLLRADDEKIEGLVRGHTPGCHDDALRLLDDAARLHGFDQTRRFLTRLPTISCEPNRRRNQAGVHPEQGSIEFREGSADAAVQIQRSQALSHGQRST